MEWIFTEMKRFSDNAGRLKFTMTSLSELYHPHPQDLIQVSSQNLQILHTDDDVIGKQLGHEANYSIYSNN